MGWVLLESFGFPNCEQRYGARPGAASGQVGRGGLGGCGEVARAARCGSGGSSGGREVCREIGRGGAMLVVTAREGDREDVVRWCTLDAGEAARVVVDSEDVGEDGVHA